LNTRFCGDTKAAFKLRRELSGGVGCDPMKLKRGRSCVVAREGGGKQAKVDCKWIEKIEETKINGYKEKRFLWRVKKREYPEMGRRTTIGRGRGEEECVSWG
jgi:hypothetical protein